MTLNRIRVFTATPHGFQGGETVRLSGIAGKDRANGTFIVSTPLDTNFFELGGTEGIDNRPYGGGGAVVNAGPVFRAATERNAEYSIMGVLCSGPIEKVRTTTIEINEQPISNFPEARVTTRTGTTPQAPIPGFLDVRNSLADGREVDAAGIIYTTTVAVDSFVLNLDWNNGLVHFDSRGQTSNWVEIRYRHRVSPAGAWTTFTTLRIEGNNRNQIRFSIDVRNIANAIRDIEVQFVRALHTNTTSSAWQPFLTSVTEIQNASTSFDGYALLAIEGMSSEDIQGPFPNVTTVIEGRQVRVAGFAVPRTFSDNPAWCVMDIMTDSTIGMGIPDAEIDIASFSQWAIRSAVLINDKRRNTLDYILDEEKGYQRVLAEMTDSSHVEIINTEGFWSPRIIAESTPTFLLSETSITNLVVEYFYDTHETNVVDIRFLNRRDSHKPSTLSWPQLADWPADVRKKSIELRGVTDEEEVQRYAEVFINEAFSIRRRITFNASLQAFTLQKYDTFYFSHSLPGWGVSGHIEPGSTQLVLNLDTPVTILPATTYHIRVINSLDHTVETRQLDTMSAGTYTTVNIVPSNPFTFNPQSLPDRKSRFQFGEATPDRSAVIFRVISISLNDDNMLEVEAVEHSDAIYTLPTAAPLPPITRLPNPNGVPPPLISLTANETETILSNGSSFAVVSLSWAVRPIGGGEAPYGGAIIYRRTVTANAEMGKFVLASTGLGEIKTLSEDNDQNYKRVGSVSGNVTEWIDVSIIQGETYEYRVSPISQRGVENRTGFLDVIIHITGPKTPDFRPPAPTNLRLEGQQVGQTEFEDRDVVIEWDDSFVDQIFRDTFFIKDYIVEVWGCASTSDQAFRLHPRRNQPQALVTETRFRYLLTLNADDSIAAGASGPQRDLTFKIWARTGANIISESPAILTVSNSPPDFSGSQPRNALGLLTAATIDFSNFVIPRDIAGFRIFIDQVDPPVALNQEVGPGTNRVIVEDLLHETTYFATVLPLDRFGPGVASQSIQFTTVALDGSNIADDSITANQIIKGEVVLGEAAQFGTAVISTASIQDLAVATLKIADNAVTTTVQTILLASFPINVLNQRFEIARVTFGAVLPGDTVILFGVTTAQMVNDARLDFFIQEDDINGATIGVPTSSQINSVGANLSFLDNLNTSGTHPNQTASPFVNKSYIISAEASSFGTATQINVFNSSIVAFKRSK